LKGTSAKFGQLIIRNAAILLLGIYSISCGRLEGDNHLNTLRFEILDKSNMQTDGKVALQIVPRNAIVKGLSIPSLDEMGKASYLNFKISFKAKKAQRTRYYYKLYYQNYSYKFLEHEEGDQTIYNLSAADNFYGSWEDPSEGFRYLGELSENDSIEKIDSFRIVGNPRNEEQYFSHQPPLNVNEELIDSIKLQIQGTPEWVESIKKKAKAGKLSFEEQLYLDALYAIENIGEQSRYSLKMDSSKLDSLIEQYMLIIRSSEEWLKSVEQKAAGNNRSIEEQLRLDAIWQIEQEYPMEELKKVNIRSRRNPRMGDYEFLLVIVSEAELDRIPKYVQDISQTDSLINTYLNPFFYFDPHNYHPKGSEGIALRTGPLLNTSIRFSGENGIYVNPLKSRSYKVSKAQYTDLVNSSDSNFRKADFEQFFHAINKDYQLKNVPVIANVIGDNYNRKTFKENKEKYPLDERMISHTSITHEPGKTVKYNSAMQAMEIINPGNDSLHRAVKENVGVASRIGLNYGKWTAKIRFPEIINNDNVWNGLTCAFWLFSSSLSDWNNRNVCEEKGYLPKSAKDHSDDRLATNSYSEIDIEIVKTSKYWPKTSYGDQKDYPIDHPDKNHNVIITTTNWDLACPEPKKFHHGISPVEFEGQTFAPHRWIWWYQALTNKYEYPQENTLGKELFYQIEWKPKEIIWRIGESKDQMKVVGYINDEYTKIPNNQMIAIITQEFHYSLWWPLAPFDQNNVPYPKDDIKGLVYYVEVE
jgi:hypothetical protein